MSNYRPPLSHTEVPPLIMGLYGIRVKVVKELDSYDDRNVMVEMEGSTPLPPHIILKTRSNGPAQFLFKVHHETYSARPEILDLKNATITHLTNAGYPCPAIVHTVQGGYQTVIKLKKDTGEEGQYVAKLFEFHPGLTLEKICLSRSLCREMGKLTGWMDAIFLDFPFNEHKGIEELKIEWNLSELSLIRAKLHFVKDKSKIPLLEETISTFESTVLNSHESFSKGLIHSDINDANALVQKITNSAECVKGKSSCQNCKDGNNYRVSSIIDFGDLTFSLHIFELAIAMCYLMLNKDDVDPLEVAASVLSGYQEHMTLSDSELKHLHACICARLAQSFVYGQVAVAADETNAEYTQTHASRCIPMLEYLSKFSGTEFLNQLKLK